VRFYCHVTPEGALRFVRRATEMLNCGRILFRLKVIVDPKRFSRCDTLVVYTRRSDYDTVAALFADAHAALADYFLPASCLLPVLSVL
jgi:hypothetical protein